MKAYSALTSQLAEMCALVAQAMNHATHALLLADIEVAEAVIAEHEYTAAMSSSAEETTFLLLALQPPVAADLRDHQRHPDRRQNAWVNWRCT